MRLDPASVTIPSSAGTITVPMVGRWLSYERFEKVVGFHDLTGHVAQGGRVEMVFDERSGLLAGVGMRLLSLLNQLAALATGSVHLTFASRGGLYGYLDRNGFFDFLDWRSPRSPTGRSYRVRLSSAVRLMAS